MQEFQEQHPRIDLFFNIGIDFFRENGLQDQDIVSYILHILWNDMFLVEEQNKILEYKQESRVKKHIYELLEKYGAKQIAKNPKNLASIIYGVNGIPVEIGEKSLKKYYEDVFDWFSWEYANIFTDTTIKNNILASLEEFSFQTVEKDIMMQILVAGKTMDRVQPFVRAYQALINHRYYIYEGKVFSSFSNIVTDSLLRYSSCKKENIHNFMPKVQEGYAHISAFFQWEQEKNNNYYNERCIIIDNMEKIDTKRKEELKKDFKDIYQKTYHIEYSSNIRHAYDWILKLTPDLLYKKDPIIIFATIVLVLERLHYTCGKNLVSKSYTYIELYTLREYILSEKKSVNMRDVENLAHRTLNDMLYMIPDDIQPLFFFPVISTQKKEKQLMHNWEKIKAQISSNY